MRRGTLCLGVLLAATVGGCSEDGPGQGRQDVAADDLDIGQGPQDVETIDADTSSAADSQTPAPYLPISLKSVALWGRKGGFGGEGSEVEDFSYPAGIALSRDESEVYVHDSGNMRVKVLTKSGNIIRTWSTGGNKACDGAIWMKGLAVGLNGTIYSIRAFEHEVVGWSRDGAVVAQWPLHNPPDWCIVSHSHTLDVDSSGNIYVSETQGANIQVFSQDGVFIRSFGSHGTDKGQFKLFPDSVAVVNDRVYVNAYEQLLVFTTSGDFLRYINEPANGEWHYLETASTNWNGWMVFARREGPAAFYAVAPGADAVTHGVVMKTGLNPGEIRTPYDLAIDASGRWYVTETESHRVQVFDAILEKP